MADCNWKKIKTEYITTGISLRKLAAKYGVAESTLFARASKEKWVEQREQHQSKTVAKTLDAISKKQVDRAANIISVADILLEKVKNLVESDTEVLLDTQGLKHISGVLKDIKEVQMIKSEADLREQEARIAKLQKEAQAEEKKDSTIIIQFAEGSEEYAK